MEWIDSNDELPAVGQWVVVVTANGYFAGQHRVVPDKSVINHEIGKFYKNFKHWISIRHLSDHHE